MYELTELKNGNWLLNWSGRGTSGAFKDVVRFAVSECKIDPAQLEMAVKEMVAKDHDTAHFGVFGMLIYTYNKLKRKAG